MPPPSVVTPSLRGSNLRCLCCPQKLCCSIALKELQRVRLLSPLENDGPPGLELNYGSAHNPQTIWFELLKVRGQGLR